MNTIADIQPGQGEEIIEYEARVAPRTQSRRVALQALYVWEMTNEEPCAIIQNFREDGHLSNLEFDLFKELLVNITQQAEVLDLLYAEYLDRSVAMVDPIERIIMRMGVYELKNKPEIPYKVVINECVELAKRFGAEDGHKFVNGILDNASRQLRPLEWRAKK